VTYGNRQGHVICSITIAGNTLLDLSITITISSGLASSSGPVIHTRKDANDYLLKYTTCDSRKNWKSVPNILTN
jgi:hypothetical protein